MKAPALKHYVDEYKNITHTLAGQSLDWLKAIRTEAFNCFSEQGFPSLRDEEWRYTNVSAIEKKLFSPQLDTVTEKVDKDWLDHYRLDDAWTVVLINGHYSAELSSVDNTLKNVSVLSMTDALTQQPEVVKKYLTQAVSDQEHGFIAFNTAWFSEGLFVHVPAHQILDKPIQLLHVTTQENCLTSTRNLLIIDEMAEARIIETFIGNNNRYLTASVTEVFIGKNAQLNLYKIQNEADKAYHFGGTYVKQAKNSRFNHDNFAFGGLLARNDIHTDLGIASECNLNGLSVGINRQHIDNHTRIEHLKPYAISRELYKSVLNQRARSVFQGRVVVAKNAQKTNSEMNNRNLLLSEQAEADTKPQLEIYADDVKCAHGVTVGQLDEKSVFYFQSRGLDEETARNMLTFAFANEMIDKVTLKSLHQLLQAQLLKRFPQTGMIEGGL